MGHVISNIAFKTRKSTGTGQGDWTQVDSSSSAILHSCAHLKDYKGSMAPVSFISIHPVSLGIWILMDEMGVTSF